MAPNGAGTHPEELRRLDRLVFSKIATLVEGFARRHRLLIRKYYHDGSSWDLAFRRKAGGTGQIEVVLTNPGISVSLPETTKIFSELPPRIEFKVFAACWMDNYTTRMRSSRHQEVGMFQCGADPSEKLVKLLELALKEILDWEPSDLTERSGPNQWQNTWKTEEEFEKASSATLIGGKMVSLPLL